MVTSETMRNAASLPPSVRPSTSARTSTAAGHADRPGRCEPREARPRVEVKAERGSEPAAEERQGIARIAGGVEPVLVGEQADRDEGEDRRGVGGSGDFGRVAGEHVPRLEETQRGRPLGAPLDIRRLRRSSGPRSIPELRLRRRPEGGVAGSAGAAGACGGAEQERCAAAAAAAAGSCGLTDADVLRHLRHRRRPRPCRA